MKQTIVKNMKTRLTLNLIKKIGFTKSDFEMNGMSVLPKMRYLQNIITYNPLLEKHSNMLIRRVKKML